MEKWKGFEMFIDDLNHSQCWDLWAKIHIHPVKMARTLFPNQPPQYVVVTKLIGAYACNKGTALGLADNRERRDVYIKIASKIYCDIPIWGRSIKLPENINRRARRNKNV